MDQTSFMDVHRRLYFERNPFGVVRRFAAGCRFLFKERDVAFVAAVAFAELFVPARGFVAFVV